MTDLSNHILKSGAAKGADAIWGVLADKYGVGTQYHYRPFDNMSMHKDLIALGIQAIKVDEERLSEARAEIKQLIDLDIWPSLGGNLKTRNYYQVNKSDSVLAVAYLTDDYLSVKGGTAVAVNLGIALGLPVYVLDIKTEQWYEYNILNKFFTHYEGVPPLTRRFTAVGSRDIEDYKVKCKLTGDWISRKQYVGTEKANRLIALMEQVFVQAINS